MAFIKKTFITEKLLPNVAIEKLMGQYVDLKRSGSNYSCCCPFHHEKTPSCHITPSKQMFYCFGCKEHGNAIDFIMKYKNLGFVEAVEELANFAGIPIEYDENSRMSKDEADRFKEYYELMDRTAAYFTRVLHSPEGRDGMEYFARKRGLSSETILKSRLGFAPNNPNYLKEFVCKNKGDEQKLIELGIMVQGSYGNHAMFRNRVMIPIVDRRGRIISFGGRTLGDDKPKYMNTKETPIYKKRNELFGLYETLKDNNNRPERIVVVEGYMDVISVRQYGCTYAVASLGTATTEDQIKMMFRYTDKIIFCYDGDEAGQKAAWHALNVATPILPEGKDLRFAFLPLEHDPDSLVRASGLKGFTDYLDKAMTYAEFLIVHNSKKYDLSDPGALSLFITDTLKLIDKIPLAPMKSVALKLLSGPSGISENQLYDMLKEVKSDSPKSNYKSDFEKHNAPVSEQKSSAELLNTPMRRLMAFIVQQPIVVSNMYEEFALDRFLDMVRALNLKGCEYLEALLNIIKAQPSITAASFIEETRGTNLEKTVFLLQSSQLYTTFEQGDDLSYEHRIAYFSTLISEVLTGALEDKAKALKIRMQQGDMRALSEFTSLQSRLKK